MPVIELSKEEADRLTRMLAKRIRWLETMSEPSEGLKFVEPSDRAVKAQKAYAKKCHDNANFYKSIINRIQP